MRRHFTLLILFLLVLSAAASGSAKERRIILCVSPAKLELVDDTTALARYACSCPEEGQDAEHAVVPGGLGVADVPGLITQEPAIEADQREAAKSAARGKFHAWCDSNGFYSANYEAMFDAIFDIAYDAGRASTAGDAEVERALEGKDD